MKFEAKFTADFAGHSRTAVVVRAGAAYQVANDRGEVVEVDDLSEALRLGRSWVDSLSEDV